MPYRTKYRKSSRDYGRDRARAHIEAAAEFSREVGNADAIVKRAFFALSGKARTCLFDEYERVYGRSTREYAEQTIGKWKTGQVRMSGLVAKRLFSFMPPLMPVAQKHEIVEIIWKHYGPRSQKYVYIGPDIDQEALIAEIQTYFASLAVTYPIPEEMQRKFDWLSDDDVAIKQQLLNYFMERQQEAAIASARLNIEMFVSRMNVDVGATISKMSHTLFIGNHRLEIRADPLRQGFVFSDLPDAFIKPKARSSRGLLAVSVALLIALVWILSQSHSYPAPSANVQSTHNEASASVAPAKSEQPLVAKPDDSNADLHAAPVVKPVVSPPTVRQVAVYSAAPKHGSNNAFTSPVVAPGCSNSIIASVEGDGVIIRIDDGSRFTVAESGLMRVETSQWSTGDAVTTCVAGRSVPQGASISNPAHYAKVQATLTAHGAPIPVHCDNSQLSSEAGAGARLETIDGRAYEVSSAGLMQTEASQWRTGDEVSVCTARGDDGLTRASLANPSHYSKVQAKVVAVGAKTSISCRSTTIAGIVANGSTVETSDDRSYTISEDGLGQTEAAQWTTAETIYVCEASLSDKSVSASLGNPAHYSKVEASRN